jgi:hypothetical protein
MIHFAGFSVQIGKRWVRQRCAWCGEIIEEADLCNLATHDGSPWEVWAIGQLVEVKGPLRSAVPHVDGNPLPDGTCADALFPKKKTPGLRLVK